MTLHFHRKLNINKSGGESNCCLWPLTIPTILWLNLQGVSFVHLKFYSVCLKYTTYFLKIAVMIALSFFLSHININSYYYYQIYSDCRLNRSSEGISGLLSDAYSYPTFVMHRNKYATRDGLHIYEEFLIKVDVKDLTCVLELETWKGFRVSRHDIDAAGGHL